MRNKIKVLFIGNSHTYYNDMAYMLKFLSMERHKDENIEPVTLVHPGKTLEEHKIEPEVRFNILYGEYDYVVLQQAAHPFPGEAALIRDAKEINKFIMQTSSQPILYMTWAEKEHPGNQEAMTQAYLKLSEEIGALIAPAGIAFKNIAEAQLNIELYDTDGGHASPEGSYLVACIFYSVIYNESPVGLTNKIIHKDKCILEIEEHKAKQLQEAAWEAVLKVKE